RVVTARFLDVDVLAGRTGCDGGGRMPVIRRGDDQCIDGAVFKDAAKILDLLWILVLGALDNGGRLLQGTLVPLGDLANLRRRRPGKTPSQTLSPAIGSHDSNHHLVVGSFDSAHRGKARRNSQPGSHSCGRLQKPPSGNS